MESATEFDGVVEPAPVSEQPVKPVQHAPPRQRLSEQERCLEPESHGGLDSDSDDDRPDPLTKEEIESVRATIKLGREKERKRLHSWPRLNRRR
jgi:hypothetical protein